MTVLLAYKLHNCKAGDSISSIAKLYAPEANARGVLVKEMVSINNAVRPCVNNNTAVVMI